MKDQKIKDRPSSLSVIYGDNGAFEDRSPNPPDKTVLITLKTFV